jgi:hypothetical protein
LLVRADRQRLGFIIVFVVIATIFPGRTRHADTLS